MPGMLKNRNIILAGPQVRLLSTARYVDFKFKRMYLWKIS